MTGEPPIRRAFLRAEWRNLVMLNYEVDPALLRDLVPRGTELDAWSGRTFVSLVGFLFARTRLLGVSVPLHRTFEEVNLRFYVRRTVGRDVRRAVTFIKELVPRVAIASVARLAYNEPYRAVPMRHRYGPDGERGVPAFVEYGWQVSGAWSGMRVAPVGAGTQALPGSEEEFITEHYWGYTRQRDGSTVEYQVEHPRWRVWRVEDVRLHGDMEAVYGRALAQVLASPPSSAFLADGSAVVVGRPVRLG
jgi:uncharacterized protein YqjF (DUF2071 family)